MFDTGRKLGNFTITQQLFRHIRKPPPPACFLPANQKYSVIKVLRKKKISSQIFVLFTREISLYYQMLREAQCLQL
jgi:hypothetical protein